MDSRDSHRSSMTSTPSPDIHSKVVQLKRHHFDQFKAIVIFHLTLLMDLDTLSELIEDNSKKDEKTNSSVFSLKKKSVKEMNRPCKIFGCTLTPEIINRISGIMDHLGRIENLQREGIFRLSGNSERQRELREKLDNGDLTSDFNSYKYTAHDYATVFKQFLKAIPELLLTERFFHAYCQVAGMKDESKQTTCMQLLFHLLPSENAKLLKLLLELLNKVSNEPLSKMTAENLAILFTPHLMVPKGVEITKLADITEQLKAIVVLIINKHETIFDYPHPQVLDVIHKWDSLSCKTESVKTAEQTPKCRFKRNKVVMEENDDEGFESIYSFTDRKLSQEAAQDNFTDIAMAELYKTIIELPESSKKNKLLEDFKKYTPQKLAAASSTNVNNIEKSMKAKFLGTIKKNFLPKRRKIDPTQLFNDDAPLDGLPSSVTLVSATSTPAARHMLASVDTPLGQSFEERPVATRLFYLEEETKMAHDIAECISVNLSQDDQVADIGDDVKEVVSNKCIDTIRVTDEYNEEDKENLQYAQFRKLNGFISPLKLHVSPRPLQTRTKPNAISASSPT